MDFSWEITYELATFGTPVLNTNCSKILKIDFFTPIFFLSYSVYSERTRELGPEGPQLAGASSYSNGCQQRKAKNLMFTGESELGYAWCIKSCMVWWTYLGYITRYLFLTPSALEDLTLGNLHPSSLTVIHLNFHLFHTQLLHGMLYPQ